MALTDHGSDLDREIIRGVTFGDVLDALERQPDLVEDLVKGLADIVAGLPKLGPRP